MVKCSRVWIDWDFKSMSKETALMSAYAMTTNLMGLARPLDCMKSHIDRTESSHSRDISERGRSQSC